MSTHSPLTGPLPLTRLYPQTPPQLAAAVALLQLLAVPLPDRTSLHINHRGALTLYVDGLADATKLAGRLGLTPVHGACDWEGTITPGVAAAVRCVAPPPPPEPEPEPPAPVRALVAVGGAS